jgi:hypothetical protein
VGILLQLASDNTRLTRMSVEISLNTTAGFRPNPRGEWEERIGFSPLRKGMNLPKSIGL